MLRSPWAIALVSLFAVASTAPADPITSLYNTGVDNGGVPQANGSAELHYTLIAGSQVTGTPTVLTSAMGFPISPNGPWIGDNSVSAWIGPNSTATGPNGNYIYRTTFDLTGFDSSTAQITGQWATDNPGLDILINGVSTGLMNTVGFTAFTPFSITSGFVAGVNTLDFVVQEQGVVTGLRVEMTGTANALAVVPEPATLAVFGLMAVGGLGYARRRKLVTV